MCQSYLASFLPALEAPRGYLAVRSFLRAFSDNAQTFSSYRIHIERLLLWSLLINQKPLNQLKRQGAQDYLSFCRNPPRVWIGTVTRSRFVKNNDAQGALEDPNIPNPNWRPFNIKSSKPLIGSDDPEQGTIEKKYGATNSTINQVFSICSRFFEFMVEDGYAAANPFRTIKKSGRYSDDVQDEGVTCDSLDYCEDCRSPDGRIGKIWQRYGTDPVDLLSGWEREQLERLLNAL